MMSAWIVCVYFLFNSHHLYASPVNISINNNMKISDTTNIPDTTALADISDTTANISDTTNAPDTTGIPETTSAPDAINTLSIHTILATMDDSVVCKGIDYDAMLQMLTNAPSSLSLEALKCVVFHQKVGLQNQWLELGNRIEEVEKMAKTTAKRQQEDIEVLQNETETMNVRILKDFVAFTAHPDPASKEPLLTDRTNVTFSQVLTNIGNAYNTSTGSFTAPRNGVYQFSLTIHVETGEDAILDLYKNEQPLMRAASHGQSSESFESGGNSVIVECQEGDVLWLKAGRGADRMKISMHPDMRDNTFSGMVLYYF